MKAVNLSFIKIEKILIISFITTFCRILLQVFIPSGNGLILPESEIVKAGLLPVAFSLYAFFGYTLLILVFVLLQNNLLGNKLQKGFIFGILFAGMWVVYLFEPTGLPSNSSLIELLYYPIADGIALVLLGLLSGYFLGIDSDQEFKITLNISKFFIFLIITLVFIVGRFFSYEIIKIQSDYDRSPFTSLVWALTTGLWFSLMYLSLLGKTENRSPLFKAFLFSFIVIGIDLFIFNFFIPLVFKTDLIDLLIRGAVDIFSLFIGALAYEIVKNNLKK